MNRNHRTITRSPSDRPFLSSWSLYRRLMRLVWPYWFQIILILLMTLVSVGFNLIRPWPTAILVDTVLGHRSLSETLGRGWFRS